jgi:hypothetical protein
MKHLIETSHIFCLQGKERKEKFISKIKLEVFYYTVGKGGLFIWKKILEYIARYACGLPASSRR